MIKRSLYIFCFLLFYSYTFSQSLQQLNDSLGYYIKSGDANHIADAFSAIGGHYYKRSAYDSAMAFYRKSMQYSLLSDDLEQLAGNYSNIGSIYERRKDFDSCMYYYEKSVNIYRDISDTTSLVDVLTNLAVTYKNKGWLDKALSNAFDALRESEKKPVAGQTARCYMTLGNIYYQLDRGDNAIDYQFRALHLFETIPNLEFVSRCYNGLGNAYVIVLKYDSALWAYNNCLDIKNKLGADPSIVLHNLGELMMAKGDFSQANRYYQESLSLKRKAKNLDLESIAKTLNNLGALNLKQKKYSKAKSYLAEAERYIRNIGILNPLRENLELQIAVNDSLKNYRSSINMYRELIVIKDSILDADKIKSLEETAAIYETEKKEGIIRLLEEKNKIEKKRAELEKKRSEMLTVIVVLIFVVCLLLGYSIIATLRSKKKVEMLLKELHHRVKNNLQVLSSLLSLQSQQLTDDNAIQAVKSSEGRVNAMALIHRKLYLGEENRTIDIQDYITELVNYLVHTYGYHERGLNLDLQIEPMQVDVDKAIPLGLILNELISNAFKYAYAGHATPALYVGIVRHGGNSLVVQVRDNGSGIPEPRKGTTVSFGLKMVNTLTRELRGNLAVNASEGTTYVLNIPL